MTQHRTTTFLAAISLALASCEASRPARIDVAAIAPAAVFSPTRPLLATDGFLVEGAGLLRLETDLEEVRPGWVGGEGDDMVYLVGVSYDVYAASGAFVRHVVNYAKVTDPAPVTVQLAAGRYLVAIPDSRWPSSWIEVTIAAGHLTIADAKSSKT